MPSGIRGRANPDYSNTEYAQPWGGIDVSKPSSQIEPSSAVSLTGSIIRGGLTNSPTIATPTSVIPVTLPAFSSGETARLITNLAGATVIVTENFVYTDITTIFSTAKIFQKVYTLPFTYSNAHFGSVVIGDSLYFSSAHSLGVYKLTGTTVTEITAQNGSGPFIGGDFLFTIANRLCLWNVIGGDGNQTGHIASVTVTNGGSGYPNAGSVLFTGGGGQSATGTFAASGGVITSVTITNPGTGFLSAPTPIIVGTTGTGFTGTTTISGFTSNSTNVNRYDYVAWSFPSAYGSFDPNSTLLGGGFDQITEARGLGTGVAVFEAVAFLGHNGGFTEMVPNASGGNIEPFTFAPLWSADQGVVCRYGSMAQYGSMCCFLGYDQPYQFGPGGLTPMGDQIASLVQNFSIWENSQQVNGGLFGSIVEIEGEKHYIIQFTSFLASAPAASVTLCYDILLKTGASTSWSYSGVSITAGIYQSYDSQVTGATGNTIARDNWILVGMATSNVITNGGKLGQILVGANYFSFAGSPLFTGSLNYLGRAEAPTINIPQTTRRLLVEYENIPSLSATPTVVTCTLFGQPKIGGYPSTNQAPTSNVFTLNLPYYASGGTVPANTVLTAVSEPIGTANTTLATSLQLVTSSPIRLIRTAIIAETTQGDIQ